MSSRIGLVVKKVGCSDLYDEYGNMVLVTLLYVDDNFIIDINNEDGFSSVRLAYGDFKGINKPQMGVLSKSGVKTNGKIMQFRVKNLLDCFSPGQSMQADYFAINQHVDLQGTSIGKGFAGVMKRHNFRGLPASHGVSVSHRSHGSTGGCQDPGRVFKGKKMAGRLGGKKVTVQNLQLIYIDDTDKRLMAVRGAVPGYRGSHLVIKDSIKRIGL